MDITCRENCDQLQATGLLARLYEQFARDEARLERDLQAAKRIQGALLRPVPTEDYGLEMAARYLSAREVCGDLYEFLRYGPQQLGIGLGDVSGKGTAAALYGAVAIGIMRSLAPQKLQPAEMLKQMNQLVGERRIEGRFMTACFATWQKGRQKLRVANAGQSQPLLYKDHRCGKIELTGFPLGIYEDVAYDEWGVTLEPGNILVFHSDGITETANSEGQFFGTTRLRESIEKHHALTAAALADKSLGELAWCARNSPHHLLCGEVQRQAFHLAAAGQARQRLRHRLGRRAAALAAHWRSRGPHCFFGGREKSRGNSRSAELQHQRARRPSRDTSVQRGIGSGTRNPGRRGRSRRRERRKASGSRHPRESGCACRRPPAHCHGPARA